MKTINGKNKVERTINKLVKYLGIETKNESNQYLKITNFEKPIFKVAPETIKCRKDLFIIELANTEKTFFTKDWATIRISGMIAFAPWKPEDVAELERLAKNGDDVEKVKIGEKIHKKHAFNA